MFSKTNFVQGFLTLYHTISTFNDLEKKKEKESLLKTLWEKEKMLVTSISSLSHNVFYPSQEEFLFLIYLYFVVNAFNLDQSKNLSFDKELNSGLLVYSLPHDHEF